MSRLPHHTLRTALAIVALVFATFGPAAGQALEAPRRLYVPVGDLDAVLSGDRGGVLLPTAEYEALLAAAEAELEQPAGPPGGSALTRADYVASIVGDQLVLTATIEAASFSEAWASLPIRVGRLGVESATVGGAPASVSRGDPPEVLYWLVRGDGRQVLVLELSTPLYSAGSDRVAAIQLAGAPAGEFRVTLPEGKALEVAGVQITGQPAADGGTEYLWPVGGRPDLELRITDGDRESQADVLTFASTAFGLAVAPGEVTWTARTSLQVIGRKIDQLVATVPQSLEITGVEAVGLEAWELADDPDDPSRTAITLRWRQGFDGTQTLTFRGVVAQLDDATWTVPNLELRDVNVHTGVITVQHPLGVRVIPRETIGVRAAVSAADVATSLTFEVWQSDFVLSFMTAAKAREVHAAMTNLLDVNAEGLGLFLFIDVTPLFDSLFELEATLPADWEIQEASVAGVPVAWTQSPVAAGVNLVRIPLVPPVLPEQTHAIRIVARRQLESWPVEQTPVQFSLPEVRLPQANVVEAIYGVSGDADLKLTPLAIVGLDPARPSDLAALRTQLEAVGRTLRLGFSYQDTVFSGQIEAVREPTRLSASTLTFVELERESVVTHLETQLRVEGGGVRELQISLPESVPADIRFQLFPTVMILNDATQERYPVEAPRIVEQRPGEPADGRRIWTLKFDRRLSGDAVLSTDVREPRAGAAAITPISADVVGAERQNGYIAVIAGSDQRVSLTATSAAGEPLPLVDPVDFPPAYTYSVDRLREGRRRIVGSVQYLQGGYKVAVSDERFSRVAVPTAVCHSAAIETVVGRTGELQHEAKMQVTAIGVQSLAIRLPADHILWAALLDGVPVEVRRDGDVMHLPLPPTGTPDQLREVTLLYRGEVPALTGNGTLRQSPPSLAAVIGSGTEQPIEVLQQTWTLHHPAETRLVESRGPFHAEGTIEPDDLLTRLADWWRLPSKDDAGAMLTVTLVAFVLIWILLWVNRRRKVSVAACVGLLVLLVGLPALLFLLALPGAQQAREAARKSSESGAAMSSEFASARSRSGYAWQYGEPRDMNSAAVDYPEQYPSGAMEGGAAAGGEAFGGMSGAPGASDSELDSQMWDRARAGAEAELARRQMELRDHPLVEQQFATPQVTATPPTSAPQADFSGDAAAALAGDPFNAAGTPPMPTEEMPAPMVADDNAVTWSLPNAGFIASGGRPADGSSSLLGLAEVPQSSVETATRFTRTPAGTTESLFDGGLLSLSIALDAPAGFQSRTFRYAGSNSGDAESGLEVDYADRESRTMLTWAVAVVLVLVMWWGRDAVLSRRLLVLLLLVAVPLILQPLFPAAASWLLDGLLLAAVLGGGLWLLLAVIQGLGCLSGCCKTWCPFRKKPNPVVTTITTPALLLALFTQASVSPAQESPPVDNRPVVFVPYDDVTDPLARDQVLIPQDLFLKLWAAAHPEEQPEAAPPVPALVVAALHSATLDRTGPEPTIAVQSRFLLENLSSGPVIVPLPLGAVAIESAKLGEQSAVLTAGADGTLQVVLPEPGRQVLDVSLRIPALDVADDAGRFVLPLRPVTSGRLTFTLPTEAEVQTRVNGGSELFRIREADGVRTLETAVDAGGDISVSWQPAEVRGDAESIIQVQSSLGATFDDSGLSTRQRFLLQARQGSFQELSFTLPEGVRLRRISGDDVAGWEHGDDPASPLLTIFFRRAVSDATTVEIDLFSPLEIGDAPTTATIPQLVPQGVSRETGDVAIFAAPHLSVDVGTADGLRQVNLATVTMDATLAQPGATARFGYRLVGGAFTLTANVSRRQPETRVSSQHGAQVELRKTRFASRFEFDLRESPRANLAFALPAGYLPIDVQGDYLADWTLTGDAMNQVLTIELDQPRTGTIRLLLEGVVQRDPAAASVAIALPAPVAVNRQESQLGIWVIDALTASLGDAADWRSQDAASLGDALRALAPTLPQFGFRSNSTDPGAVSISLARGVPEFAADAVLLTAVSDAAIDYGWTLRWKIDRAAADTFLVSTPDWLGDQVEFRGSEVRQVERINREDGTRVWRITLHQPVRGEYALSALATRPLPTDDRLRIPELRFLRPDQTPETAADLSVQRNCLVLVNLSRVHRLDVVDDALVNRMEREQLPLQLPDDLLNQALEIAELPVGRPLPEWNLQSLARTQAAAAAVLLADLRTVVAHDGSWRTQASYTVRNRGRQFLAVRPPVDGRLLSVLVRQLPSQAIAHDIDGAAALLVPLPATSLVDLSFEVRMTFAGRLPTRLPRGLTLTGREIELPAPQVVSQGEFEIPVLETVWTVDLPEDLAVKPVDDLGSTNLEPGDDTALAEAYDQRMLAELKGQLAVRTEDNSLSMNREYLANLGVSLENATRLSTVEGRHAQEQEELIALGVELQQKLEAEVAAEVDVDGDTTLERNDFGRNYIIGNSADILSLNGLAPTDQLDGISTGAAGFNFRVDVERGEAPLGKDDASRDASPAKGRGLVREQLGNQAYSFGVNGSGVGSGGGGGGFSFEQIQQPAQQLAVPQQNFWGDGFQQQGQPQAAWLSRTIAAGQDGEGQQSAGGDVAQGAEWTAAGGLSLPMELPSEGQRLTFTKNGGDPQLTLSVRPSESLRRGAALLWGVIVLAIGLWLLRGFTRSVDRDQRQRYLVCCLFVVGLAMAAFVPGPFRWCGVLCVIVGITLWLARRMPRAAAGT
jgi:hypothetical protein